MAKSLDGVNINKNDAAIARAIDASGEAEDNLIRLSTGVVLKAQQANPNILIRIMTAQPRPKPPVVFIKTMGREMENPDDPDYISRVKAWEMDYNAGMLNALVGLGTTLHSLPKGMEGPHPKVKAYIYCKKCGSKNDFDKLYCKKCNEELPPPDEEKLQWMKDYKALGLPTLEDSPSWRYITWVLFKAAVVDTDTALIGEKVKALSGVKEADVKSAETFPESDQADR